MKKLLIIFVFIALQTNVLAFVNEPFSYTLRIKNKESQIDLIADKSGVEVTFGYTQPNRNITVRAKSTNELLDKLKTEKPNEYGINEMEELCSWIEKQLSDKKANNIRYNTLKIQNLKGNIKNIEITRYSADQAKKEMVQDTCCVTRSVFNEFGNIMMDQTFNSKNILKNVRVFKYHPNGLIKEICFIDNKENVTYREVYELDENSNYAGGKAYQENDKLHRTFKIFDQNEYGQWTRFNWYSLDGSLYREEEITYEGNLKVHEVWKSNGELKMDFRTTYDENGERLTEEGKHPFLGTVKNRIYSRIDAFDEQRNWIQKSLLTEEGKVNKVIKRSIKYY